MNKLARMTAMAALVSIATVAGISATKAQAAPQQQPAPPKSFQTILNYNQQDGTFATLTAGPKERIVITEINCNVLAPAGTSPAGGVWVGPRDIVNTGWLGSYQAQFVFSMTSNFSISQDRFSASKTTSIILEPGQSLTWSLRTSDGEDAITPFGSMNANLSIRAETTTLP